MQQALPDTVRTCRIINCSPEYVFKKFHLENNNQTLVIKKDFKPNFKGYCCGTERAVPHKLSLEAGELEFLDVQMISSHVVVANVLIDPNVIKRTFVEYTLM